MQSFSKTFLVCRLNLISIPFSFPYVCIAGSTHGTQTDPQQRLHSEHKHSGNNDHTTGFGMNRWMRNLIGKYCTATKRKPSFNEGLRLTKFKLIVCTSSSRMDPNFHSHVKIAYRLKHISSSLALFSNYFIWDNKFDKFFC